MLREVKEQLKAKLWSMDPKGPEAMREPFTCTGHGMPAQQPTMSVSKQRPAHAARRCIWPITACKLPGDWGLAAEMALAAQLRFCQPKPPHALLNSMCAGSEVQVIAKNKLFWDSVKRRASFTIDLDDDSPDNLALLWRLHAFCNPGLPSSMSDEDDKDDSDEADSGSQHLAI